MNRTILAIFISIVLCGCGLTVRPSMHVQAVDIVAFDATNTVPVSVISSAATAVAAALGVPCSGGIGAVVGIGVATWIWWYRRKKKSECNVT